MRLPREQSQSGGSQEGKRQWALTEIQEVQPEAKEESFCMRTAWERSQGPELFYDPVKHKNSWQLHLQIFESQAYTNAPKQ